MADCHAGIASWSRAIRFSAQAFSFEGGWGSYLTNVARSSHSRAHKKSALRAAGKHLKHYIRKQVRWEIVRCPMPKTSSSELACLKNVPTKRTTLFPASTTEKWRRITDRFRLNIKERFDLRARIRAGELPLARIAGQFFPFFCSDGHCGPARDRRGRHWWSRRNRRVSRSRSPRSQRGVYPREWRRSRRPACEATAPFQVTSDFGLSAAQLRWRLRNVVDRGLRLKSA